MDVRCKRCVGYEDRTGAPEGLPRDFIHMAISFPGCVYGRWWYVNGDGSAGQVEGWYIQVPDVRLIGVSQCERIVWRRTRKLESCLSAVANNVRLY
jgi:hypothetical protein